MKATFWQVEILTEAGEWQTALNDVVDTRAEAEGWCDVLAREYPDARVVEVDCPVCAGVGCVWCSAE